MAEPITLAALGVSALAQGVTFLYAQATEIFKRRRERKDAERAGGPQPAAEAVPPVDAAGQAILAGTLRPGPVDETVLDQRENEFLELLDGLASYASGVRPVDLSDAPFVARVEALRGLLELAYGQRITFVGEQRESTGATVDIKSVVKHVDGVLTVAKVRQVRDGAAVTTTSHIDDIAAGAEVTVFHGDVIGG